MAVTPQSWQDVRSLRDLRPVGPATATPKNVQAMVTSASFHAIAPFRCFDSRQYPTPIRSGFDAGVLGPWMDSSGVTRLPVDAPAVTYTLTVTETAGSGFVSLYPYGTEFPGVSSINWSASGVTVANNGTVRTGEGWGFGRHVRVLVAGGGSTHLILDITGYYL